VSYALIWVSACALSVDKLPASLVFYLHGGSKFDTMKKESNSLLEDRQPDRISDVGIEIVDPLNRMELDRITYLHFWTTIFAPSTKKAVLINSNVLRSHKEEKDEECRDHKPNKKPHEK
jgi:hypothetical protein